MAGLVHALGPLGGGGADGPFRLVLPLAESAIVFARPLSENYQNEVMSTAPFAVFGMDGWELILVLAVLALLVGAKRFPQITRSDDPGEPSPGSSTARARAEREARLRPARSRFLLWLAQGCGLGRIPLAPGTFGTLAGVVWSTPVRPWA